MPRHLNGEFRRDNYPRPEQAEMDRKEREELGDISSRTMDMKEFLRLKAVQANVEMGILTKREADADLNKLRQFEDAQKRWAKVKTATDRVRLQPHDTSRTNDMAEYLRLKALEAEEERLKGPGLKLPESEDWEDELDANDDNEDNDESKKGE